jgi:hypothetical protein
MDVTDFEVTAARLLDLLIHDDNQLGLSSLVCFVEKWAHEYDGAEKVTTEDGCNTMHLLGMTLCVLLYRYSELRLHQYDLRTALGQASAHNGSCGS